MMAPSDFVTLKNGSGPYNRHPKCFVQKLWSKTYFCKMVVSTMCLYISHAQAASSRYHLLKFGNLLLNSNITTI